MAKGTTKVEAPTAKVEASSSAQADLNTPTLHAEARNAHATQAAPLRSVPGVREPRSHPTTPPRYQYQAAGSKHTREWPSFWFLGLFFFF